MLQGWIQIAVFCLVLTACVPLLGGYMARVYTNERVLLTPVVGPRERRRFPLLRVNPRGSSGWRCT
jgi:K+-transporting ATPase ATPase A chain